MKRLRNHPVVAIVGPRQVGKTTLARQICDQWDGPTSFFDLEDPEDLQRLVEAKLTLAPLKGLIVIDEIQRRPELFPILRVLVDSTDFEASFLVLGSASPDLLKQFSESLAGRIIYHELSGFSLSEVGRKNLDTLWLRGSFPRSFLASDEEESYQWRRNFIHTFLERDLPNFGVKLPAHTIRRFWTMLAHWHGQIWNASEFARSFGVAHATIRRYLDTLTSTYVVRQMPPWHENLKKRQVKAPKIYLQDSGLLHTLLGLPNQASVEGHPKLGASWEGFALQAVVNHLGAVSEECFFWATHAGAELDLLVMRGNLRLGFEFKHTSAPRTTKSMHVALEDLKLDRLDVIHAGEKTFPLSDKIRALSIRHFNEELLPLDPF